MPDTLKIVKEADQLITLEGKLSKAIDVLEELGEEIKKDPLLSYDYPMILKKIGSCHLELGQVENAEEYLKEALEVAKRDLNKIERADIRAELGLLELQTGGLDKALEYAQKAWEYIGTKRGKKFAETKSNTATILGKIYYEQGKYPRAIKMFRRALEYAKGVGYTKGILGAELGIIDYYHIVTERPDIAKEHLEGNVERAREFCRILWPQFLLRQSMLLFEEGERTEARLLASKALRFTKNRGLLRQTAQISEHLGKIYSETKQDKADAYFKKAFDAYNEGGYNPPTEHPKKQDWFTSFDDA
jgi:tetratricopeptide (TPR) repeat protein